MQLHVIKELLEKKSLGPDFFHWTSLLNIPRNVNTNFIQCLPENKKKYLLSITLIPKTRQGQHTQEENCRPISLLNLKF